MSLNLVIFKLRFKEVYPYIRIYYVQPYNTKFVIKLDANKHMLHAWPAELLETKDSVSLWIEELALSLLQGILGSNSARKGPIIFIASCLGDITLIKFADIYSFY